jgi:hypothetical protein
MNSYSIEAISDDKPDTNEVLTMLAGEGLLTCWTFNPPDPADLHLWAIMPQKTIRCSTSCAELGGP